MKWIKIHIHKFTTIQQQQQQQPNHIKTSIKFSDLKMIRQLLHHCVDLEIGYLQIQPNRNNKIKT